MPEAAGKTGQRGVFLGTSVAPDKFPRVHRCKADLRHSGSFKVHAGSQGASMEALGVLEAG